MYKIQKYIRCTFFVHHTYLHGGKLGQNRIVHILSHLLRFTLDVKFFLNIFDSSVH